MSQTSRAANSATADTELCYQLAGGMIRLPSVWLYMRTLAGAAIWLGAPLCARLLARLGARAALHCLERWWACGLRQALGIRLDIAGLEHINPNETYVITPLHEGFADIVALLRLPLQLRFVVRDEFATWRLLGPYLRDTGQIPIRPEQGSRSYRQLLRAARDVFAAGESLVIFPQGSILGIEADFQLGAFALARALQRPILPVALTGSHRVWEYPYTPRLRYGQRMSLRVLEPISVEAQQACHVDAVRRDIQQRLKAVALLGAMAVPRRFVPSRDGYWDGYAYRIDPQFAELAADVEQHRLASNKVTG
jgi:1-acyl-sn-glycerol-3-phosphate acyltransferase